MLSSIFLNNPKRLNIKTIFEFVNFNNCSIILIVFLMEEYLPVIIIVSILCAAIVFIPALCRLLTYSNKILGRIRSTLLCKLIATTTSY